MFSVPNPNIYNFHVIAGKTIEFITAGGRVCHSEHCSYFFCHHLLFISNLQLLLLLDNCLRARVAKAKWITSAKRNWQAQRESLKEIKCR